MEREFRRQTPQRIMDRWDICFFAFRLVQLSARRTDYQSLP